MNPLKFKFLPLSFGISLFGLFFSMWNVLSFTEDFCFSSTSCQLFSEFAVLGISFWWFGILFFTISLILSLFGLLYFGKLWTSIGVCLDFILLCVMFYTMPCLNCLLIGFTIAATYFAYCFEGQRKGMPLPRPKLLYPWLIVFIMIVGNMLMSFACPTTIYGDSNSSIHIYFSAGCSACAGLIEREGDRTDIAWYPVQEYDDDVWEILYMKNELAKGHSFKEAYAAIKESGKEAEISDIFSLDYWVMQFHLWRNAGYVSKAGSKVLPFVEFQGAPSQVNGVVSSQHQEKDGVILLDGASTVDEAPKNSTSGTGIDSLLGDVVGRCGDDTEPCPE